MVALLFSLYSKESSQKHYSFFMNRTIVAISQFARQVFFFFLIFEQVSICLLPIFEPI